MSPVGAVLAALIVQQTLFALLWCVLAAVGLARRATLHWAAGVGLVTGGLGLIVMRDNTPRWLGFWLAVVLLYAGFAVLWRGVELFARKPPAHREQLLGLLLYAGVLGAVTQHGSGWMFVSAASAPLGYVMLRTAFTVQGSLQREFGRANAISCASPFWLTGFLLVLRSALAPLAPTVTGSSLHDSGAGNVGVAVTFVAIGLVLNMGLVGLVCSRMLRRLQRASNHDVLTGLLNRRGIEARLQQESARLGRQGQPFSVLSIDVDHFKRINDRHGHPAGDAVLRALAQTLSSAGREVDLAARTGGEEFWILMPATSIDGAQWVAERLLRAVRAMRVPVGDTTLSLTVSIGVATAERAQEPVDALVQRLDAALYRAKQAGRDRVELAGEASAPRAADEAPAAWARDRA